MDSIIGRLRVSLGLDSAAFETGAKRASAEVNAFGGRAEKAGLKIGQMGKAIAVGAAAIGGLAIASKIKEAVSQGLEYASSLGETAQQLGVTTKTLQQYRYVASQVGIEEADMDKALSKLTLTIGAAANGAKKQSQTFGALGISIRDANGHVKDAGDLIPEIAEALQRFDNPAQQATIRAELFGKAGLKMGSAMADGARGVNSLRNEASDLGIVLTDEMINNADAAADNIGKLNRVLSVQIASVVATNAKEISEFASAMTELAVAAIKAVNAMMRWNREMNQRGQIRANIESLADDRAKERGWSDSYKNKVKAGAQEIVDRNFGMTGKADTPVGTFRWKEDQSPGAVAARKKSTSIDPFGLFSIRSDKTNFAGSGGINFGGEMENIASVAPGLRAALSGLDLGTTTLIKRLKEVTKVAADSPAALRLLDAGLGDTGAAYEALYDKVKLTKEQQEEFNQSFQQLTDQLFPEEAALREYQDNLAKIDRALGQHKISVDRAAEARRRLGLASVGGEDNLAMKDLLGTSEVQGAQATIAAAMAKLGIVANDNAGRLEAANVRIAQSFGDMATETINSLQQVANAVQGGGFLNILSSVVGLGLQLGGIGAFGKTVQTNINASKRPGRANGGPVNAGGLYMVGERGPELFLSKGGGTIIPNHALGGGKTSIQVLPSKYFDVHILEHIGAVAPSIAQAGGDIGFAKVARSGSRKIGW